MKNYKLQPFLMEKPRTCASRLVHQDESTSSTIRVATRIVGYDWERGLSQSVVDFVDTLKQCDNFYRTAFLL